MQPIQQRNYDSDEIFRRFSDTRAHTVALCEPLETEDFIPQPVVDVSPVKWNIAHTTWFFEEMILKPYSDAYREFHPAYSYLFNSYYNSVGERTMRDRRGDLSRPTVSEVFEYRKRVEEEMETLLRNQPPERVLELTELGINHEQQHQELLVTDLKFTLSLNPLAPVYREDFALVERLETGAKRFLEIEGGIKGIGFEGNGFCFDNELGRHEAALDEFEISRSLVTNGEFAEFIEDGGYEDFRLWHSEGWDWVRENRVTAPLYWTSGSASGENYTLAGNRRIVPEAPVCHVSFYEASAFAAWRGMRLPTEFEWEAASSDLDWGIRWEWTNSAYLPYPGFRIADGAVGEYNGKFMVNQMVLRGASVATPEGHSRNTYRNFFHPHLRWQFTGIRLVK